MAKLDFSSDFRMLPIEDLRLGEHSFLGRTAIGKHNAAAASHKHDHARADERCGGGTHRESRDGLDILRESKLFHRSVRSHKCPYPFGPLRLVLTQCRSPRDCMRRRGAPQAWAMNFVSTLVLVLHTAVGVHSTPHLPIYINTVYD